MKHLFNIKPNTPSNRQLWGRLTAILSVAVLVGVGYVVPVAADFSDGWDDITTQSLYGEFWQYVPEDKIGCATSGAGGVGSTTNAGPASIPLRPGSSNAQTAYNYFIDRGLTSAQSAGIVGNLYVESGGVDPTIKQGGGGPGRGIAQWSVGGRWDTTPNDNVVQFAGARDPLGLDVQLDFIWYELTQVPGEMKTMPLLQAATTPAQAAEVFMRGYERPADDSSLPRRISIAEALNASQGADAGSGEAGASSASGGGGTGSANCSASGAGGIGVGKIVFPLKTTKSSLLANKPTWCYTNQNNCHHDYNAADIFTPEGTQVIVASPGKVVLTESIAGKNADTAIKGDDGNVYFYQHMAPGSLVVTNGQQVAAAQDIGKVGNTVAAFGTSTHLHFDMQPPPATNRPGCAGAACNAYNFLNVQPLLIEAFQGLPQ